MADSGSKNLERLLERIAANKDQEAFAELYTAQRKAVFQGSLDRQAAGAGGRDHPGRLYTHLVVCENLSFSAGLADNLDDVNLPQHRYRSLRKTGRENSADDSMLLTLPSECPTAIEHMEAHEEDQNAAHRQLRVFAALQALNPVRRDLVLRAYLHGESREQLSKMTGVPVNTVKTWIR